MNEIQNLEFGFYYRKYNLYLIERYLKKNRLCLTFELFLKVDILSISLYCLVKLKIHAQICTFIFFTC